MLARLFGSRTTRPSERGRSFRPELEHLEDRLTPSPMGGPGGPPDHGPPDHGPPGGPPGHINAHDSFNTTITDSFNTSINNVTVNQYFNVAQMPQAQVQQQLTGNLVVAYQQNLSALIQLVGDEFRLAADTYFSFTGSFFNNTALVTDMHNLQLSIQQNPLEAATSGEAVGYLVFDLALGAYVSAGANGQHH